MATVYGYEIGIGVTDMTIALVITQFVGIPFPSGFGRLARRKWARNAPSFWD